MRYETIETMIQVPVAAAVHGASGITQPFQPSGDLESVGPSHSAHCVIQWLWANGFSVCSGCLTLAETTPCNWARVVWEASSRALGGRAGGTNTFTSDNLLLLLLQTLMTRQRLGLSWAKAEDFNSRVYSLPTLDINFSNLSDSGKVNKIVGLYAECLLWGGKLQYQSFYM